METDLYFSYIKNKEDINCFWEKRDEYFSRDIIPNREFRGKFTKDDINWFFSKEYKERIMMLFERSIDPLHIVFIKKGNLYIGFIVYVIYNSEDGKCFILDYCINQEFRNNGIGAVAFKLLEMDFIKKGAKYIDLNVSNTKNQKFWFKNGFFPTNSTDKHNPTVYRKVLSQI